MPKGEIYTYSADMLGGQFKLMVSISYREEVTAKVYAADLGEEYILHLTTDVTGAFVGKVRSEYQNILQEIADKCFDTDVFQSQYAHHIIQYIRKKYGNELEFL